MSTVEKHNSDFIFFCHLITISCQGYVCIAGYALNFVRIMFVL